MLFGAGLGDIDQRGNVNVVGRGVIHPHRQSDREIRELQRHVISITTDFVNASWPWSRFNGATVFQPWKLHLRLHFNYEESWASMGPRPFSRGNESFFAWLRTGKQSLQWGHGLSAVETGQSQSSYGPQGGRTSMGPRPFSRGNSVYAGAQRLGVDGTSMGPRPFSRGNESAGPLASTIVITSMGPRPFSRGNFLCSTWPEIQVRDFNGATAFQPWKRHCPP